jgi:quercetin dioxygenase-like cupin family protein
MPHLIADTSTSRDLHGVTFTSFARTATGASELAAWRADFRPRTPGEAHTMTREEILHVLSGALTVEIDTERFTALPGEAVLVPSGAVFSIGNDTDELAQAWVVTTIGMNAEMRADGAKIVPPWAQ